MRRTDLVAYCLIVGLGAACRRGATAGPVPPADSPTLDLTDWTAQTELYMEHPALVAGRTVRFAVHLTRLADFQALTAGQPAVELTPESGGPPVVLPGSPPARPGTFRVEGQLPPAGRYRWALTISAPGLTDRHDLGTTDVFPDDASAAADAEKRPEKDPAAISYLKEQQWSNPFATAVVQDGSVRSSIRVPAAIEPVTGGEAIVTAPADGRYTSSELPSVGDRVAAGQELGRLEPRLSAGGEDRASLDAAVIEAQTVLDGAKADLARAERLLEERAVPARRVEEARRSVAVADARAMSARARLAQRDEVLRSGGGIASGNAFVLRAPIRGRVAEVFAALGASYIEGAALFRIVRTDRVELQAQVPPADAASARTTTAVALEVPGGGAPIDLKPDHVHDAGVIDPKTRALPLQIEVENDCDRLLVGQTGTAILFTGRSRSAPVVPQDAVLMEAGRPYVFVQISGERFARRFVEIVSRDNGIVGLRSGVSPGERVVTRGAYDIQLASAAKGLPAEGHVH
jgi:RND family efflux transporter MFP subunit